MANPNPGNQYDERNYRGDPRGPDPRDDRRDDRRGDPRDDRRDSRAPDKPSAAEVAHLIPTGRHRGRRVEHDYGWAGEGSERKEQIGVLFEFTEIEPAGRTLTWYGYFTDKTLESTFKAMRSMGWEGNDPMTGWPDASTAPDVDLVVQHEKNLDGDWIARIRWVNGGGVAMKSTMNDAERASFSKRIGGIAARLAAGSSNSSRDDRSLPDQRSRGRDDDGAPPPSDDDQPPFQRGRGSGNRR